MRKLENKYVNISPADLLAAAGPLSTQDISGSAKVVADFENDLCQLFQRKHAVCVCSGTVSIYCALQAIGVGPGDEVILPATAVVMSALPVLLLGGTVRVADTTAIPGFGFDPVDLEAQIGPKTKAVISVPLWGYPVPMDELVAICRRQGVALVEDVSQSHGATWNGKYLGTFGEIGCFSTHERKLITTGEGGFILTDISVIADKVNVFRRYGADSNGAGNRLGCNFKLSGFSAALGRTQAKKLSEKISARSETADRIRRLLKTVEWIEELPVEKHSRQNFYSLVFRITHPGILAKAVDLHLSGLQVISDTWRYGFRPLYAYPLFGASQRTCKNAEALIEKVFTLPCHEGMDEADCEQVANAVSAFPVP